MHNHNKNNTDDGGMKMMMWMMVICCAFLILPFLFLGRTSGSIWPILGIVAVILGLHYFMHRGHHNKHNADAEHDHNSEDNAKS